jgi:hypothetical protein
MLLQMILCAVDAHARQHGETRSGSLTRAALDAMRKPIKSVAPTTYDLCITHDV